MNDHPTILARPGHGKSQVYDSYGEGVAVARSGLPGRLGSVLGASD